MTNTVFMPRKINAQLMTVMLDNETPYFCRLAIDKSCYEVGKALNEDWREVISDNREILSRWNTEDEAQQEYDMHCASYKYDQLIALGI